MAGSSHKAHEESRLQLRQAFGNFATGVTIVTTMTMDGEPRGFTANSFTSVSLDPPLLLVCLAQKSSSAEHFRKAESFAVNILEEGQRDVSSTFARPDVDRFAATDWRPAVSGAPLIDGSVGWFDCAPHEIIDAGDHIILIGRVVDFEHTDKRPLAYLRGHYLDIGLGEVAAEAASLPGGVRVGCVLVGNDHVVLQQTPDGWTLPMGDLQPGIRDGRAALELCLADAGIKAEIGFLYSVFEAPTGNSTWLIFHGELEAGGDAGKMRLFPVDALPFDAIPVSQVLSVLRRFQSEYSEARFGLYVDDTVASGRINPIERTSTHWETFKSLQEAKQ